MHNSGIPRLFGLAFALLIPLASGWVPAAGCSVFALTDSQGTLVGKNLDWHQDFPGHLVVNVRGTTKSVLPWHGHGPELSVERPLVVWVSRYGSVTFTAYGRDFIAGGMNEKGLVVEQATLTSEYPTDDGRPGISCAQWMQYQLDNHASVTEVLEHLDDLRVDGEGWHFLIADQAGDCAIIEYLDGEPVVFSGEDARPCIMANATYAQSRAHIPMDVAFGGDLDIARANDSYGRFVRIAALLRDGCPDRSGNRAACALGILDGVRDESTIRTLVYDIDGARILWRTRENPRRRWIDLGLLDFAPGSPVRILDVNAGEGGSVQGLLREYTVAANRSLNGGALGPDETLTAAADTLREATAPSRNIHEAIDRVVVHPTHGFGVSVVAELNEQIHPLPEGSPLHYADDLFAPLADDFARARVVGLGEATHGTAEFFELKHRLFRHLVEHHGHRALGYEFSFAASLPLDRYVTGGVGSLDSLLAPCSWIQANEEVRALLQWMREVNRKRDANEKIHFLGIDSQLDMWDVSLQEALIRERCPQLFERLQPHFMELESRGRIDYRRITADDHAEIASLLDRMAEIAAAEPQQEAGADALTARHLITCLQRSHAFLYCAYQGTNDIRDLHMTEHALWIGEFLGEGGPYTLWAHDAHIGSNPHYYGEDGPGSMGERLEEVLGPSYLRIGTAFSQGSFVAVQADSLGNDTPPMMCTLRQNPPLGSVNALLAWSAFPRYLLPLRSLPTASSLHAYLSTERPLLGVGDCYAGAPDLHYESPDRRIRLTDVFDALFHLDHTRGIRLLNDSR